MSKQQKSSPKDPLEQKISFKIKLKFLLIFLGVVIFGVVLLALGYIYFLNRFYPGIYIARNQLTGLTYSQAEQKINKSLASRAQKSLTFSYLTKSEATASSNLENFTINLINSYQPKLIEALDQAFEYGHLKIYFPPKTVLLNIDFNQNLGSQIAKITERVNQYPIDSQLKIEQDQINVTPSQEGLILDEGELKKRLEEYLVTAKMPLTTLPLKKAYPKLSYPAALEIKKRLDEIKLSPLKLVFKDQTFYLNLDQILAMIDLENTESNLASAEILGTTVKVSSFESSGQSLQDSKLTLNKTRVQDYLKTIAKQIDTQVQEPLFSFDPASPNKITAFAPPVEGKKLNLAEAEQKISFALLTPGQDTVQLPVTVVEPKNKLSNEMGVKELIGRGISNFGGSIANRIFNINHAASKINGILIPPGQEFSFVDIVGDISAASGYKQAYVIKSGKTVLDDGGGVCQVSTTLFRTALNAGVPITARTAHAYRVGYYEQGYPPGLDATIFHPSVDFRFKNDTPGHILIQAYTVGLSLYVDFYGTSDGRVATLSRPTVTNVTPAPPELRRDDPTIPKGTVKQVDFAASGAIVVFSRTVTRAGQTIINDSFRSNYRPWQAVYLVGTQ